MKTPRQTSSPAFYVHNLLRGFLGDTESLRETFETVVPLLEEQDQRRLREYKEAKKLLDQTLAGSPGTAPTSNIPQIIDAAKAIRGHEQRLRRGRVLFQGNSIVSLVSRFDQYFAAIMRLILRNRPERLEKLSIGYIEATKVSSIEELRDRFVKKEVEDLLRESHTDQFKYLATFTGDFDEPALWSHFIEITERRNLHVHTGGRVSSQYIAVCKQAGVVLPAGLKEHALLPVDTVYFNKACLTFSEMGFKLAQTVMRKFFPKEVEVADKSLVGIGIDFLQRGQFKLAEMAFDFGVKLKQNWTSNDGLRKTFIINKAAALKFLGRPKDSLALLNATDWSSAHPRFLIAVQVLREELEQAAETLRSLLRSGDLTERQLLEWPVFKGFRESEPCRSVFREVLGRDLGLPADK